jgi:putative ABC transport system permease protein
MLRVVLEDFRFAIRGLLKRRGFTTGAILTLALGIGPNSAIFSVINAVLLSDLPYKDPSRLVIIWNDYGKTGQSLPRVSVPDFVDYQQYAQTFEGFAAALENIDTLTGDGESEHVDKSMVTPNFFSLLGVNMQLGRNFLAEEAAVGPPPRVVILSHRLWQSKFGGRPDLIGQSIQMNGFPYTVVGVLPASFKWYCPPEVRVRDAEVWTPLPIDPETNSRTSNNITVLGRLRPGATLAQAQQDMDGVAARLRAERIEHKTSEIQIRVVPFHQDVVRHAKPVLVVLFGAVLLILLIACANIGNLTLARALANEKEFAIRSALGASRLRILSQVLVESLVIAITGGAAGLLLSALLIRIALWLPSQTLPRPQTVSIDGRVLAFSLATCLLAPIIFGLAPALQASRVNLVEALKHGGRTSAGLGRHRLRKILVAAEVALSLILLAGTGLMIRTVAGLESTHLGFEPDNVITFAVNLPWSSYGDFGPDHTVSAFRQFEARIATLPGVEAAGGAVQLPLTPGSYQTGYAYDEESEQRLASLGADWGWVSPGYFSAIRAHLISGRFFTEADDLGAPPVAIVDDVMARKVWPGLDPIGQGVKDEGPDRRWKTVVGVIEHIPSNSMTAQPHEQIYIAQRQIGNRLLYMAVRTHTAPAPLIKEISRELQQMDGRLALYDVRALTDYVSSAKATTRYSLMLVGSLGAAALLLATLGIYGVMAYCVAERTSEYGIRMALGAERADLIRLALAEGATLISIGIVIGLAGAMSLTPAMSGLLFGVKPADPLTLAGVSILLGAAGLSACYLPALRASRVDPLQALGRQ